MENFNSVFPCVGALRNPIAANSLAFHYSNILRQSWSSFCPKNFMLSCSVACVIVHIHDILMKFIHRFLWHVHQFQLYWSHIFAFCFTKHRQKSCSLIKSKYLFWFFFLLSVNFVYVALRFEHNYWKILRSFTSWAHTRTQALESRSPNINRHQKQRIVLSTWLSLAWVCVCVRHVCACAFLWEYIHSHLAKSLVIHTPSAGFLVVIY